MVASTIASMLKCMLRSSAVAIIYTIGGVLVGHVPCHIIEYRYVRYNIFSEDFAKICIPENFLLYNTLQLVLYNKKYKYH